MASYCKDFISNSIGGKLTDKNITSNNALRLNVKMSRVGVQRYINQDGTVRREYRPPEEVFKKDSIDSFRDLPVTDKHPNGLLSFDDLKKFSVGHGKNVTKDSDGVHLGTEVIIDRHEGLKSILEDKNFQASCGYTREPDFTPGVVPNGQVDSGQAYDLIQRDIRGNHIAIVDSGRAGPEACFCLDAQPKDMSVMVLDKKEGGKKMKVKIGDEEQTIDEASGKLLSALDKGLNDRLAKIEEAIKKDSEDSDDDDDKGVSDEVKAKLDALSEKNKALSDSLAELKKENTDEKIQKKVNDLAKEKIAILDVARKIVKDSEIAKLDGMSVLDIKKMVLQSKTGTSMDSKSETYVEARWDAMVENLQDTYGNDLGKFNREAGEAFVKRDSSHVQDKDEHKELLSAWEKPLAISSQKGGNS